MDEEDDDFVPMNAEQALAFFDGLITQIEEESFGPMTKWTPEEKEATARIRQVIEDFWYT